LHRVRTNLIRLTNIALERYFTVG